MTDTKDDKPAALAAATPAPAAPEVGGADPHAVALTPEEEANRRALEDDWGQYVAAVDIPYGNVLAYPAGAPVPASNVKRWNYDGQGLVVKVGTKAGQQVLEGSAARTPSTVAAPGD